MPYNVATVVCCCVLYQKEEEHTLSAGNCTRWKNKIFGEKWDRPTAHFIYYAQVLTHTNIENSFFPKVKQSVVPRVLCPLHLNCTHCFPTRVQEQHNAWDYSRKGKTVHAFMLRLPRIPAATISAATAYHYMIVRFFM